MSGDSFFDVPAGYGDADLEMAALEQRGGAFRRRFRAFTQAQIDALRDGNTVMSPRLVKATGERYEVEARRVDEDEVGMVLAYSVDGSTWHPSAVAARLAREAVAS